MEIIAKRYVKSVNRTKVELKPQMEAQKQQNKLTVNRTKVELKHTTDTYLSGALHFCQSYQSGIETNYPTHRTAKRGILSIVPKWN